MKFSLVILLVTLSYLNAQKTDYTGYRLVRIYPTETRHANLVELWEAEPDFDLWAHSRTMATVFLSPAAFEKYKHLFVLKNIHYEIVVENFQPILDQEEKTMRERKDDSLIGRFARHNEINNYLLDCASENPSFISTYTTPFTTVENRIMRIIRFATPNPPNPNRKFIWIDCGIHAREWISPATCMYMIHNLIEGWNNGNQKIVKFLTDYEVHILPVVNPDGYEFSHVNTRMWRKNRRVNAGSTCLGVDLNRNFGHQWMTGGSSNLPCSDTFAGPSADSENETKAVEWAILQSKGRWISVLTIHTYGLWWFTTWGYTYAYPSNYQELVNVSKSAVDAFKSVNGLTLVHGSSSNILYIASGGTEDWTTVVGEVPYSYCLELRPGQTGVDSSFGFALPADRIPFSGAETLESILEFGRFLNP